MKLKAILIKVRGEEEKLLPKEETFTKEELCVLLNATNIQFIATKLPNCIMIINQNAKEQEMWHLQVNNKASELAKGTIGDATIVGDAIICNKMFIKDENLTF